MILRILPLLAALCLAPLAAMADQVRLLAFGDSLTAGYGLERDDGLVPRLQDWLRARGHDVEIINDGITGDTTAGGKNRIASSLMRHQPDAVMVELGGNDLLINTDPQLVESNLDAILRAIRAQDRPVLLVGIAKPDSDLARAGAWAAIWPRLAQRHGTLLQANLYAPFFTLPESALGQALQADMIHPSPAGVAMIVAELGPVVEELLIRAGSIPETDGQK